MGKTIRGLSCLLALGGLIIVVGCGPDKRDRKGANLPAEGAKGVPDWVSKGSGAFSKSKKEKIFHGVGAISGVRSYSLMRRASEDKARVEVGNVFDTFVKSLAKSYARSVGNLDTSQEEQLVQEATKAYTNVTLKGVQIVDHYFDKPTKTMFTLAELDMGVFTDAITKVQQMNNEFKEYLKENSEGAFGELKK